jgi:hypothetical protein
LHDEVGAGEFGIPPEMKDMFKYGHLKPKDFDKYCPRERDAAALS